MANNTLRSKLLISYFSIILLFVVLINVSIFLVLENFYIESKKKDIISAQKNAINFIRVENSRVFEDGIKQIEADVCSKSVILIKEKIAYNDFNMQFPIDNFKKDYIVSRKLKINNGNYFVVSYPLVEKKEHVGNIIFFYPMDWGLKKVFLIEKQIMIISILALVVVFIYSVYISGSIINPLNKVIEAIESIKVGKFNKKMDVKGYSEVQKLCCAFNSLNNRIAELDNKRRQFVADASHELKSPLAGMKVLVESLMAGGINDKEVSEEFLMSLNNEIDRLTNVVNGLLELAKIENSDDLKTNRLDLKLLLEDVIKSLKPIAKTRNININFEGDSILYEVNRDNIFRAFYNIIENAIKYSNENSKVDVTLLKDDFVKVIIRDYGIGIPEEDIPYIFDRFYRVDKTRARQTGGSGLGLSIAKHIIKLHKGDIEVDSKVGEGTAFIIKLPM
ncbi:Sensor histidine kinase YycG [Caloramator mitchellensis]|uniref:histidine kinase n=2 Tax=Caloramator mitchellensis TaxID=908809 RepID=A0A0R3JSM9_CALMK|nr:Sensor histidine kinase YycG [Caloramator mitchellensis]